MAGRTVIAVPYHLDEHLPGLEFVLPPDQVITADLPGGGIWERLAAVESAVAGAVSAAGLPDIPLYVHVDFDVLDPGEVPGVRFPTPGGPAASQLAGALRSLLATGRVAAITLACTWYPGNAAAARLSPVIEQALASR